MLHTFITEHRDEIIRLCRTKIVARTAPRPTDEELDAIAGAVTGYAKQRAHEGTERLGRLAHELRNLLNSAALAFEVLKSGHVGISGGTGAVLERSWRGLGQLVDRELAEARLGSDVHFAEKIPLREFIEDVEVAAAMEASARGIQLSVAPVPAGLAVHGDRQILAAVVANLLQNAFKFTRADGHVLLRTYAADNRIRIEVEDECGGLPPGKAEALFRPFEQQGADRSGLGLGLDICRRGAKLNNGALTVVDKPGYSCIFTLELPLVVQTTTQTA